MLFTSIFLLAVALSTCARLWLSLRQIRHVASRRGEVPPVFADRIALAAHQKAADYTIAKVRLGIVDLLIGVMVLLVLTLGGGLQGISGLWAGIIDPSGLWHGVALVVSIGVLSSALDLPISVYRVFVIEARFGFNRMSPALFIADLARNALLGLALGIPLVTLVLWLMAQMGPAWWLYVWFAWMGFNILILLIYPNVIAPLFNTFTPLSDTGLQTRIEALLSRCGFRSGGLYVMDGSKRSSHGNAYFSGFGASKRIVLFDTLLARLAPAEVEAVLAHELGHFRHRHIWKRVGVLAAVSLLLLWVLGWLVQEDWFYAGLAVTTQSTAMALLLFALVAPVFTFYLQPLASLYSRRHEYEADAYAAQHSNASDLRRALVKLYEDNAATLTPDPWHSAFYDSHPPAAARIGRLQHAV